LDIPKIGYIFGISNQETMTTKFSETKEFHELRNDFERTFSYMRLDREKDKEWNSRGCFYESGETNNAFKAFMHGYQVAKCKYQLENA
jgi:hypothetical protein